MIHQLNIYFTLRLYESIYHWIHKQYYEYAPWIWHEMLHTRAHACTHARMYACTHGVACAHARGMHAHSRTHAITYSFLIITKKKKAYCNVELLSFIAIIFIIIFTLISRQFHIYYKNKNYNQLNAHTKTTYIVSGYINLIRKQSLDHYM
jgi:hypothetical protein